jgi:hypothetical protein
MEEVIKCILGTLLIILSIDLFIKFRNRFLIERKKEDYIHMSYTIQFVGGAFVLFIVGIRLIYDSF